MHRYFSFYTENQTTPSSFAESGNKIPTIVQKFYTRLGNNLHEIANKFFWGQFRGNLTSQKTSQFGTKRACTLVTLVKQKTLPGGSIARSGIRRANNR
jgi:hypothetical protein